MHDNRIIQTTFDINNHPKVIHEFKLNRLLAASNDIVNFYIKETGKREI